MKDLHDRSSSRVLRAPGDEILSGDIGTVIGTRVDAIRLDEAIARVTHWAQTGQPAMVCFTNAHALVTARQETALAQALSQARLCLPDGAPVAWVLGRLRGQTQPRVSGPDLMWAYLEQAAERGEPIFLYGGSPSTLVALQDRLREAFPGLVIAGALSPPFRALDPSEDADDVERINASGARTVWVGLGCPKQEIWMHAHLGRVRPVMLGVGAAFDFHAGLVARAPGWMRASGLEWLHRLLQEPSRLWRRYLYTNAAFLRAAAAQLLAGRRARGS